MKCPNCRCVIPSSMVRCLYCGKYLPLDDDRTFPIYESVSIVPIGAGRNGKYGSTAKQDKASKREGFSLDLSIFNDDGSLDLYKCLAAFAMIDGLLLLMMLSILLLLL